MTMQFMTDPQFVLITCLLFGLTGCATSRRRRAARSLRRLHPLHRRRLRFQALFQARASRKPTLD